ncbi:hypothetical protein ABZ863_27070 [Saccharomonospora sp. NPDC046836]|uniref:hypothetical protein n=1 Tax=Saccharomonospora sp. NPDC046836 TaxID=3156921 RepID=UPI0033C132AD
MNLPANVDLIVDDAAQALVRTLATETGKQAVGWFANLWRRKHRREVDEISDGVERDREQLRSADEAARDPLAEALARKWAEHLRRLLRDDPSSVPELVALTQQLRQHSDAQVAPNPVQVGLNLGKGDFYQATFQTINRGNK